MSHYMCRSLVFIIVCCHGYLMCVEEFLHLCDLCVLYMSQYNQCVGCVLLFVAACCYGYLVCVEEGGELAEGDDQVIKHLT